LVVTTPRTQPLTLRMVATGLPVMTSPPCARTLADSASVMAPMPPTGRPVEPRNGISRGSAAPPSRCEASDSGRIKRLNGGLALGIGFELGVVELGIAPADIDLLAIEWLYQGRVGAHEGESVTLQLEIVHDLGFERARRIGDGCAITRHEFDRRCRTAETR